MTTKLFIDRPILSICISVLLIMVGIIGLLNLPMEQYPDIAPPTITVSATYTGASAETLQKSVIVPLEESINGVENMLYMTSTATNTGSAVISIYFKQGTNYDMAAVNVQNRVSKVTGQLPAEVTKIGVTTEKRQSSQLKILCLYSPDNSYSKDFLNNYFKINIAPRIQRITGVGEVNIIGSDYAMRIWLDPSKMAQYGLVPSDITNVLGEQNIESPIGKLGTQSNNTFQYTLKYRGRYETAEEYGNLVVKSLPNGDILRIKDVARVELGAVAYEDNSEVKGHPGSICMVMQTAGSNANEIINHIDKLTSEINTQLPKGIVLKDLMSTKDFLDASIINVIKTLLEAILLVIVVVYLFLQSVRSTIIPSISIIVSLIGTFAFIYLAGFSINLLTLFALVLVIGTVVDDAIVVVEAVQAKFDEGYQSRYKATVDAMEGITSAIITTSLVFMAVFIPVCFMGGTSGTFYTQFGVTMAVAVAISAINALTLSPALCALFMTPHKKVTNGRRLTFSSRFHLAFDTAFHQLTNKYKTVLLRFFSRKWIVGIAIAGACIALFFMLKTTKTGLIPDEDTGTIFVTVTTSPGSSLAETQKTMNKVEQRLKKIPQIHLYAKVTGYNLMSSSSSMSNGSYIVRLKNWNERQGKQNSKDAVIGQVFALTADIKEAKVFAFAPPMVMGYGVSNGLEIYVQDRQGNSIENLQKNTNRFIDALNKRPEIQNAMTSFDTRFPQYSVDVDAAKCKRQNVSPADVLNVMSSYIGGNYASNINRFSKLYRVMIQAGPQFRLNALSLNNIYVRSSDGNMISVAQFVTLKKVYGPEDLTRFNLFNAIMVSASAANGYSSGEAIKAVQEVAKQTLPSGYGFEFSGLSRDEASSSSSTIMIFVICLIFVYIILCCLYESIFIPIVVMLSIPFGLLGSFLFAKIFGVENNIYMQTGLIMLIGLLSKTSILLTEYASTRHLHGMTIVQAALSAASVRLRPILMTALCMIIGLMPLVFSTGAGANGNISLGVGVVGGMLLGTVTLLIIEPVLFIVFQTIQERVMPRRNQEPESNNVNHETNL
jgi:hydrophobe/amphiphile efflux-1 (HAE1) family protein